MALLLAILFAISPPRGYSQQVEASPPPHKAAVRMPAKGVPNFGQVSPNLYRGALPSAQGLQSLKGMGIDIVVDLRPLDKTEETEVGKLGMQYVSIPSHCPFPTDKPWAQFLRVIQDNPGKKIFVHCRLGEDRTGMAVAAYRIADEGWSAAEAMREMQSFGFSEFHHAMCPGLDEYERTFPERLKTPAFRSVTPPPQEQGASR